MTNPAHGELADMDSSSFQLNSQKLIFRSIFNMNTQNIESVDFYSSAYLMACGENLTDTYKRGSQTVFVFNDSDTIGDFLNQYFAMQATVNASSYAQAIKSLKSVIHGHRITNNQITNYDHNRKETQ